MLIMMVRSSNQYEINLLVSIVLLLCCQLCEKLEEIEETFNPAKEYTSMSMDGKNDNDFNYFNGQCRDGFWDSCCVATREKSTLTQKNVEEPVEKDWEHAILTWSLAF